MRRKIGSRTVGCLRVWALAVAIALAAPAGVPGPVGLALAEGPPTGRGFYNWYRRNLAELMQEADELRADALRFPLPPFYCIGSTARESDEKALTVMPWSRPSASWVVMTVTPLAKRPRTARNWSESRDIREAAPRARRESLGLAARRLPARGGGAGRPVGGANGGEEQGEEEARVQHLARRHEVAGDPHQEVGHVTSAREDAGRPVEQPVL